MSIALERVFVASAYPIIRLKSSSRLAIFLLKQKRVMIDLYPSSGKIKAFLAIRPRINIVDLSPAF